MSPGSARIRLPLPFMRALLATVALVSQLVLGSLLLPDEAAGAAAQLRTVVVLCTGAAAATRTPAHHRHHPDGSATCPLEIALALPAVILPAAVVLPSLATSPRTTPFTMPPARGPPASSAWALHARAPPHLT